MLPLGWLLQSQGAITVSPPPGAPSGSAVGTVLYLAILTQIAALRGIPWRSGFQTVADPLLVATGLWSPGLGVGLVAWLATFDGRVPGRSIHWWGFFFNRALFAIAHVLPSIAVAPISRADNWWGVPAATAIYALSSVGINYFITAILFSFIGRTSFWNTIAQNVGAWTLLATLVLSFSGGILYLLLLAQPWPVGYIIAPGLFGFVLAVLGNIADAQVPTRLKH